MRLETIAETRMSPRQRELSERITARRGAVRGPYRVWLNSPEVCDRIEALGAFARFESSLPEHLRLLTLLVACRVRDAQYSWNAHVGQALAAGLTGEVVEAIAQGRRPPFAHDADRAFWRFCDELLRERFVSSETYERAAAHFSPEQLVDAVGSLGNYVTLSLCLNAFEVDLQPGVEPPFPDVRGHARVTPG